MEAVYWHNVMPKDDKTASTAPANATYFYKIRIKGINVVLVPDNAVSSSYTEGDVVWVKNPYGRCMTQFSEGTVTRVNSQHSLLTEYCEEHSLESDAPNKPGKNEDSDTSEDSTTKKVPETIQLRWSTKQKFVWSWDQGGVWRACMEVPENCVCVLQLGTHLKMTLQNDNKKALNGLARLSNS